MTKTTLNTRNKKFSRSAFNTTLMDYQPQTKQATISTQTFQAQAALTKKELWKPQAIQTKGLSQAIKWLMENLPNQTISIEEVVETAIWRLTQQGQI